MTCTRSDRMHLLFIFSKESFVTLTLLFSKAGSSAAEVGVSAEEEELAAGAVMTDATTESTEATTADAPMVVHCVCVPVYLCLCICVCLSLNLNHSSPPHTVGVPFEADVVQAGTPPSLNPPHDNPLFFSSQKRSKSRWRKKRREKNAV